MESEAKVRLGTHHTVAARRAVGAANRIDGAEWLTTDGYVAVSAHWHPYARRPSGTVLKHRLVMEKRLGRFYMTNRIAGYYGEWYDRVDMDGHRLDPRPSQRLYNHSPDGFAWGYAGSGPAQLALAILRQAGVPAGEALALHQAFKREHVATLPVRENFVLHLDVLSWAAAANLDVVR